MYAVGGYGHTLFISTDGKLYGMGYNYDGQLGTGDRTDRSTPVEIAIPDL
ncbi:MAG: RCC1 domain-containing protein [Thermoproteota archaeon]